MTLAGLFDKFSLGGFIIVAFFIYMYIVKANVGANSQGKDYEQMKRNEAEQQRKRQEAKQTQTVEQTTTTTTTTTSTLGNWNNSTGNEQQLGTDSRVNYTDPTTSAEASSNSLDAVPPTSDTSASN